jgi:hypothetical protein
VIAGTPMFMAPEQANGETLDHRADLFSLGSVLYAMCTGRPPFRANSALAVLKRVVEDTPRPIQEIVPEAPAWLCEIIVKLHAKKPEDRFATAREVADRLGQEVPEAAPAIRSRFRARLWVAAAVLLALLGALGSTEATGVTNVRGTVIRLFSPEGTLVVEVDDPGVSVKIDGPDIVITGAGAKEIRLRPGNYTVEARKDGKIVRRELVTVTKRGKQVVRVSQEPTPVARKKPPEKKPDTKAVKAAGESAAWERAVAVLSAAHQVKFVGARLQELNRGFDGKVGPTIENGAVTGLSFQTEHVSDISPVAALTRLTSFHCCGDYSNYARQGLLIDLSPLKGLPLKRLHCITSPVSDLSPLRGMSLTEINIERTRVSDLSPLKGMPLRVLNLYGTPVADLRPLKGTPLVSLMATHTRVSDLSPLKGSPLEHLNCGYTPVADLTPLKGLRLRDLICAGTEVTDLSPLKGLPLVSLHCSYTRVADLTPLKGTALRQLVCNNTKVTDLSPLKDMPLTEIWLDFKAERDAKVLRAIRSLKTINGKPVAQFWKEVEANAKAR